ncbi:ABC transporter ATP-binding protein [Bacillus timonensis]|nr:ABC transporter ATP-binding protein [Bacillus timonensis]
MQVAILCKKLRKQVSFKEKQEDIIEIDEFKLKAGEQVAIMGPSGSGKTSLLNLLAGLDVPTEGSVEVLGSSLQLKSEQERDQFRGKHIGMVFQEFQLFPYMTALENVLVQGLAHPYHRSKEALKIATDLLHMMGLSNRVHHKVTVLSKGQQQRVAIARALFNEPKLMLVDEPTSNLDAKTGLEVIRLIKGICKDRGCTLVVVTHDVAVAGQFERIEYMEKLNQAYADVLNEVVL